ADANGAIATFYDIQSLPPARPDGGSFVTVTSIPSPKFVAGDVITVVGRAAQIWGTGLREDLDDQRPGIKAGWKANPEIQREVIFAQAARMTYHLRGIRVRRRFVRH